MGELAAILLGLVFYFVPTTVAAARHHHNFLAIMVLNLLLGWTVICWIGALIWACTAVRQLPLRD